MSKRSVLSVALVSRDGAIYSTALTLSQDHYHHFNTIPILGTDSCAFQYTGHFTGTGRSTHTIRVFLKVDKSSQCSLRIYDRSMLRHLHRQNSAFSYLFLRRLCRLFLSVGCFVFGDSAVQVQAPCLDESWTGAYGSPTLTAKGRFSSSANRTERFFLEGCWARFLKRCWDGAIRLRSEETVVNRPHTETATKR